ncbi:hypothetical protein ABEH28_18335 [Pseudomonas sp. Ps21-P2]
MMINLMSREAEKIAKSFAALRGADLEKMSALLPTAWQLWHLV